MNYTNYIEQGCDQRRYKSWIEARRRAYRWYLIRRWSLIAGIIIVVVLWVLFAFYVYDTSGIAI